MLWPFTVAHGEPFGLHLFQYILPARQFFRVAAAIASIGSGQVQAFGIEGIHRQPVFALGGAIDPIELFALRRVAFALEHLIPGHDTSLSKAWGTIALSDGMQNLGKIPIGPGTAQYGQQ